MFANTTGMTDRRITAELQGLIGSNGAECGSPWVAETLMPQVGRGGASEDARGMDGWPHHGIEIAVGVTSENHYPGS